MPHEHLQRGQTFEKKGISSQRHQAPRYPIPLTKGLVQHDAHRDVVPRCAMRCPAVCGGVRERLVCGGQLSTRLCHSNVTVKRPLCESGTSRLPRHQLLSNALLPFVERVPNLSERLADQ